MAISLSLSRVGAISLLAFTLVQGQIALPSVQPPTATELRGCVKIKKNPDTGKTTPEILKSHGYSVDTLQVKTGDGYFLTVYQITNSQNRPPNTQTKPTPVFLNHGLLGNSLQWVSQNMSSNLATYLADQGYTVFLGNARGSSYSTIKREDGEEPQDDAGQFNPTWWNFTFHEMGYYDVPAVIDKITDVTGSQQIYYVGHSMGGVEYYVMLSTRPDYNQRIKAGFMLAPAVYVSGTTSALKAIVAGMGGVNYTSLPQFGSLAATTDVAKTDCLAIIEKLKVVDGFDGPKGDYYNLPKIGAAIPDSTSTKTMAHFGQMVTSGIFRQFDYRPLAGQGTNMDHYQQATPPAYDFTKIIATTYAYCGVHDSLVSSSDCSKTYFATPGRVFNELKTPGYDHFDFAIAVDALQVIYQPIGNIMNTLP